MQLQTYEHRGTERREWPTHPRDLRDIGFPQEVTWNPSLERYTELLSIQIQTRTILDSKAISVNKTKSLLSCSLYVVRGESYCKHICIACVCHMSSAAKHYGEKIRIKGRE